MTDPQIPDLLRVEPRRLVDALVANNWRIAGARTDAYWRLVPTSGNVDSGVLIPADPSAPDFDELLRAALHTAFMVDTEQWNRHIRPMLAVERADTFLFRKETAAPSGLISWKSGEDLVQSARATLIAGAKARIEPARHFGNRFGQFANRYIDRVWMAQSGVGSYVVTALAPADARVPIQGSSAPNFQLEGLDVYSAHAIAESVVQAIESAVEAAQHFNETGSLSGFDAGVSRGLSSELAISLRGIASQAEGSDITVEYAPPASAVGEQPSRHRFELTENDARAFDRGANHLTATTAAEVFEVRGRVHLLTKKQAGSPGVVGIDDGHRKYRVRLGSDEQYHVAVMAHDTESPVTVTGELSREGTLNWLYGAQIVGIANSPAGTGERSGDVTQSMLEIDGDRSSGD